MTIQEAMAKPGFKDLSPEAKAIVLRQVSPSFGGMSERAQLETVRVLGEGGGDSVPAGFSASGPPPPPPDPELGDRPPLTTPAIERAASGFFTEPLAHAGDAIAALARPYTHPREDPEATLRALNPATRIADVLGMLARGVKGGADTQLDKMTEAYNARRPMEMAGHAAAAALPVIGPMAASVGERAGAGDIAGAGGQALGLEGLAGIALGSRLMGAAPEAQRLAQQTRGTHRAIRAEATAAREAPVRSAAMRAEAAANATAESRRGLLSEIEKAKNAEYVAAYEKIRRVRLANTPTDLEAANTALGLKPKHYGRSPADARSPARSVLDEGVNLDAAPSALVEQIEGKLSKHQATIGERLGVDRVVAPNATMRQVVEDSLKPMYQTLRKRSNKKLARQFRGHLEELEETISNFQTDLRPRDMDQLIKRADEMITTLGQSKNTTPLRTALGRIRKSWKETLYAGDESLREAKTAVRNLTPAKRAAETKAVAEMAKGVPKPIPEPGFPRSLEGDRPLIPGRGPIRPGMIGEEIAAAEATGLSAEDMLQIFGAVVPGGGGRAAMSGARLLALLARMRSK